MKYPRIYKWASIRREAKIIDRKELIYQLRRVREDRVITVGFDGYIDSILKVRKSIGPMGDSYFSTMQEFGAYIQAKAKKSCSLELRQLTEKLGGNMPIFSQALSGMNVKLNCIGAMGFPKVLPIFSPLEESNHLVSVCQPGTCQALEFDDGKLMLARNEDIEAMDFALLKHRVGLDQLINLAEKSDLLAFLNWSELQGSSSIWQGYLEEVFPKLSGEKRRLFVDLSDCSHKSREDICEMLELLQAFTAYTELTLSFNRNEVECVARAVNIPGDSTEEIASGLYHMIGCKKLIVHLVDSSCCVYNGSIAVQRNRHIAKPVLSTGGGDNFNAGFVYALLNGFGPEECMTVANGFSSYYVSHGKSPGKEELIHWLSEETE